jgi:hypothetical protein
MREAVIPSKLFAIIAQLGLFALNMAHICGTGDSLLECWKGKGFGYRGAIEPTAGLLPPAAISPDKLRPGTPSFGDHAGGRSGDWPGR